MLERNALKMFKKLFLQNGYFDFSIKLWHTILNFRFLGFKDKNKIF